MTGFFKKKKEPGYILEAAVLSRSGHKNGCLTLSAHQHTCCKLKRLWSAICGIRRGAAAVQIRAWVPSIDATAPMAARWVLLGAEARRKSNFLSACFYHSVPFEAGVTEAWGEGEAGLIRVRAALLCESPDLCSSHSVNINPEPRTLWETESLQWKKCSLRNETGHKPSWGHRIFCYISVLHITSTNYGYF